MTEVASYKGQFEKIKKLTADLKRKYPEQSKFNDESLLFFMDVDCSISRNTLYEIRTNTIKGKQNLFSNSIFTI